MDLAARAEQLAGQRLGREQMSAGAAGGEHEGPRSQLASPESAPGQREHHPHAEPERQHRGSAIRQKRQGHALGRDQVQARGHVDRRLQPELDQQAGRSEQDEQAAFLRHSRKSAQHDEREQRDDGEADD